MASVRRSLILALALVASLIPLVSAPAFAATPVFINEIHYDNTGGDTGEFIEVAGPAGTDLSTYSLVLYNGNGGAAYNTVNLASSLFDDGSGYGFAAAAIAGIQNGSPDGIALVNGGTVVQFLSYEGSFTAADGPAAGMTSTDIGVSEASSAAVGSSLQLGGTGTMYEDFTWEGSQGQTFATVNANQAFGSGPTPGSISTTLVINEVDYDQPGTDTAEFVEIKNISASPIDLDPYAVLVVNGSGGGASIATTIELPALSLAAGAYYVVCANAANTESCDLDVSPDANLIQNGAPDAVALVLGSDVVDSVSYEGSTGDPYTEAAGAPGDSSSSGFMSIARIADGVDTGINSVDFSLVCITPGAANVDASSNCDPPAEVKIHEIQSTGGDSPLVGDRVIIQGVVVGDEETFDSLAGFFVQEEDGDVDSDPLTSEGIFVFNHAGDDVNIGDLVTVEGTVGEFYGNTQLSNYVEITVDATGSTAATPTAISLPLPVAGDLEQYEGMAVSFAQELVVTEYFNFDRYGEVVLGLASAGSDRPMNPTATYAPGSADGIALADFNARSRVTIDDGISSQNPDFVRHPVFRDEFTLSNYFRGGDTVTDLVAAVYETYGHKLFPSGYGTYTENARPTSAPSVGGDLTVATLNTLNYFLTLDDGPDICGPLQNQGCRGADDAGEFGRQRAKLLSALLAMDADVVGLVELENTFGVSPEADLAAGLNAALGSEVYGYIDAGVVGTDVIRNGFIYKLATVQPVGEIGILDSPAFLDPMSYGDDKNRAALAVTFKEFHGSQRFTAAVNHFKSKGSECGAGDDSPYAGSCNLTRTMAAEALVDWMGTNPTEQKDSDWLILGDLNSYDMEDPIVALEDGGFTDLVKYYEGANAFSYVFDGQWGYLDYAMATESMADQVTATAVWHLNSEEADIFDYDTSYKSNAQDALFEGDKPYRSSDHDAVLIGVTLEGKRGQTKASKPK